MKITILVCALSLSVVATAQVRQAPLTFFDSTDQVLPILIQSAMIHSPQLKYYNVDRRDAELDLALSKRELLRNVYVSSNYSYGNVNTIFANDAVQPVPVFGRTRGQVMYSAGAGISLNLEQLLGGTRLRTEKQKLRIEKASAQVNNYEARIREQVITLFQEVKLARRIMLHQQTVLQNAQLNKTLVERRFKDGSARIAEQMAADQAYNEALLSFEKARNDYQTSVLLLEEVVGMQVTPLLNRYTK